MNLYDSSQNKQDQTFNKYIFIECGLNWKKSVWL